MSDVVCLGETMVMLAPHPLGALSLAESLTLGVAGAESNVAAWLAALGHHSVWCGRVGDDPFGDRVLADLRGRGVDVSCAVIDPSAATGLMVKDPASDATTVWYYRGGSAGSRLDPSDAARALRTEPRAVHVTGVTLALSPTSHAAALEAMRLGRERGATVSFDVNHRARLWPTGDAAPTLLDAARQADLVFVGADEAAALWGTGTSDDVRALLTDVPTLVVKDGPRDATAYSGEEVVRVTPPQTSVVEPVGAGDAFAAGYLHGLLTGRPVRTCLTLGHHVAAQALSSVDDVPRSPLSADELRESISERTI